MSRLIGQGYGVVLPSGVAGTGRAPIGILFADNGATHEYTIPSWGRFISIVAIGAGGGGARYYRDAGDTLSNITGPDGGQSSVSLNASVVCSANGGKGGTGSTSGAARPKPLGGSGGLKDEGGNGGRGGGAAAVSNHFTAGGGGGCGGWSSDGGDGGDGDDPSEAGGSSSDGGAGGAGDDEATLADPPYARSSNGDGITPYVLVGSVAYGGGGRGWAGNDFDGSPDERTAAGGGGGELSLRKRVIVSPGDTLSITAGAAGDPYGASSCEGQRGAVLVMINQEITSPGILVLQNGDI